VIRAAGVVVPAHDEEDLLPRCLAALRRAERSLAGLPLHLVVAADACGDRTAAVAREAGATVVELGARCVGSARAAGIGEVLRRTGRLDPASVWLATTDADTVVPPDWLARQLAYAAAGWDAVVGTVRVTDWSEHPPAVQRLFEQRYRDGGHGGAAVTGAAAVPAAGDGDDGGDGGAGHPHVHGANLGFTARAYLAAGGFGPFATAEDHAFVSSLAAVGGRILRTGEMTVVTSARRLARAPLGFGHLLSTLAEAG
jgi:glycosyltransferase involved in cell wall biosynthesis